MYDSNKNYYYQRPQSTSFMNVPHEGYNDQLGQLEQYGQQQNENDYPDTQFSQQEKQENNYPVNTFLNKKVQNVINSLHKEAQRDPIQQLHLHLQSLNKNEFKSSHRSAKSGSRLQQQSQVETVYKNDRIKQIDDEYSQQQNDFKNVTKQKSKYKYFNFDQNNKKNKEYEKLNAISSLNQLNQNQNQNMNMNLNNEKQEQVNNYQNKNKKSKKYSTHKQINEQIQNYYLNYQPISINHITSDSREHSILLNKYSSNKRFIITQINQLLKLNELNQIKIDTDTIKSKISQLTILCRRIKVNLRSKSLKTIKSQSGKRRKRFYGEKSPTKRIPQSQIVSESKQERHLSKLIRQEKDRINKSSIRITQLDNYLRAKKNQLNSQQQFYNNYNEDNPYNLQSSSFTSINNNNTICKKTINQQRHKKILLEKKHLIKESLDNMVEYRSKKIDQVYHQIDLLKKQVQIIDFKIQKAKVQNKKCINEIKEKRVPKVIGYQKYNNDKYNEKQNDNEKCKQNENEKCNESRQSEKNRSRKKSQKVQNFKYLELHIDPQEYKNSKGKSQINYNNKNKSISNRFHTQRQSSSRSTVKSKFSCSSRSKKSTPNISFKYDYKKQVHAKSHKSFYRGDTNRQINKDQRMDSKAYKQYYDFDRKNDSDNQKKGKKFK